MMTSIRKLRSSVLLLVLLTVAVLPTRAMGQGHPRNPRAAGPVRPVAGRVTVKLLVVAATDSHEGVDPRLLSLQRHLRFLRYRGYDLLNTHVAEISTGGNASFSISGGRQVNVTLLRRSPEKAQFRIQMFSQKGKLLDTTLSVSRNGTFIVAGPRYKDGILILPLQVRY